MQIWTGLEEAVCETPSAVACGYFDGLHIGHAAVIGEAVAQAAARGLQPGVFTFTLHGGHPAAKPEGCELVTEEEKYRILEHWGVRRVLCPDFSQFQSMSPEAFVEEILCRRLREWWSFLWTFRCSVRSAMRRVRMAICTSGEPVSPSWVAFWRMTSCFSSLRIMSFHLINRFDASISAAGG